MAAEGKTGEELAAELGVSAATLYNCRRAYGGMDTDAVRELKELREQNSRLDGPIKIVSIVDEHTRECLGGLVERSVTGEHLIVELDRVAAQRGAYPAVLRCDNGPELACAAMADWASGQVGLHFIPPGEPWRNGYIESFNSRIRDECLNINSFWSLAQARVVITDWKHDYDHHRRHSALGHQPPARYAASCTHH